MSNVDLRKVKERPILFSGEMICAILDGKKAQTRSVVKLPQGAQRVAYWTTPRNRPQSGWADPGVNYWTDKGNHIDPCPYGFPGDRLWVRETFLPDPPRDWQEYRLDEIPLAYRSPKHVLYKANPDSDKYHIGKWYPSIYMPRWASRIALEIVNVRVERLQDISEEDSKAEGVYLTEGSLAAYPFGQSYREAYVLLWNSINAKRGYGWNTNPWVWVVEFKRVEQ